MIYSYETMTTRLMQIKNYRVIIQKIVTHQALTGSILAYKVLHTTLCAYAAAYVRKETAISVIV